MGDRETAVKFHNQGVAAAKDKSASTNLATAFQLFASACHADPTWAHGYYQYGNNCSELNYYKTSIAAYQRALQCEVTKEEEAKIYANMGWSYFVDGQVDKSFKALHKALELDKNYAGTWTNLSQVYSLLDDEENAIKYAKKGFDLDPDNPVSEAAYAFALLFGRQLKLGFEHFEIRFKWRLHQFLQYPYPKWLGEDGKTVFLVADQGMGDTLCFARFVHQAAKRAKFIHAYVQSPLMRLFMHAFMDIPNINLLPFGSSFPQADAWTTFVSLPFALGLSDEEIRQAKQIDYPRVSLPTTWMVPDQKLHIGIQWGGSKLNDIDKYRTIPVEYFLDLCRVPGVHLYSIQVGDHTDDANIIGAHALIKNLSPYIGDVTDTCSLLRELDLVICCESALAHICAMVGKECWVASSFQGRDYRIGHRADDMLWTPRHRVFRQGKDLNWKPVFERIAEALNERVSAGKKQDRLQGQRAAVLV
jgi:tetratricopeptide (TPR) repeat protein